MVARVLTVLQKHKRVTEAIATTVALHTVADAAVGRDTVGLAATKVSLGIVLFADMISRRNGDEIFY